VLRHVVQNYIHTATPVGSRFLSKRFDEELSPASIRNVMYDLEERGFLSHPHTSAGRVPTDNGYRYYVDYLMEIEKLTENEISRFQKAIHISPDPDEILRETSKLLGKISNQLSVVTSPHLNSGILEKLELVPVSVSKLLVIISIRSGLVRTIMLEIGVEMKREVLDRVGSLLNERLVGLTLNEIRDSFADRLRDLRDEQTGLIRMFIDSVDLLFDDSKEKEKFHLGGTKQIIDQPEFVDPKNFRSVIEMVENEEIIVHLLEKHDELAKDFVITIGAENNDASAQDYSFVTATYDVNGVQGRVGVIGPKRMNYSRLIPLVDHVAKTVARMLRG
jgi:heat-inducible transcriptional repressor